MSFGIPLPRQAAKIMTKREVFALVILHGLVGLNGLRIDQEVEAVALADRLLHQLETEGEDE